MLQTGYNDEEDEGEKLIGDEPIPQITITLRKLGLQLHSFKLRTPIPKINQWLGGGINILTISFYIDHI